MASQCRCFQGCCPHCSKEKRDAIRQQVANAYKGVFYDNDFSYIKDPCYQERLPGDSLKQLSTPLGGTLDVSGETRVRYHRERNHRGPNGITGVDDNFWLTRYRLAGNYRANDWLRLYGEFLYADSRGENAPPLDTEENHGDMRNLFADVNLLETGLGRFVVRGGRQELLYGSERLVSPLDWGNTRRTFDGFKLMYRGHDWAVDGFFVNPVVNDVKGFDESVDAVDLYGVYASRQGLAVGTVDTYFLTLDNSIAGFRYDTLGTRVAGKRSELMYEFEGGVQFGDNSNGTDHDAGFLTAGLGSALTIGRHWEPTVWLWYDWASGENDPAQVGRGDDGFDHLFPLAHKYLGFIDLFGRRNIHDANMQVTTPLSERLNMLVWYHYFFLDQKTTPYDLGMVPYRPGIGAVDRELGHEIDLAFTLTLNPRNQAVLGYSHFNAGEYYETPTAIDQDADFFWFQYQTRF